MATLEEVLPLIDASFSPAPQPAQAMLPLGRTIGNALLPQAIKDYAWPGPVGALPQTPGKVPPAQPQLADMAMFGGLEALGNLMPGGVGTTNALMLGPLGFAKAFKLPAKEAEKYARHLIDTLGPEQAFQKVGVALGADGKVRFEVPDIGARLEPMSKEYISKETGMPEQRFQLVHPRLNVHQVYDIPQILGGVDPKLSTREVASHYPQSNLITINRAPGAIAAGDNELIGSALHETQHGIQKAEGFARGSNLAEAPYAEEFWSQLGLSPQYARDATAVSEMQKFLENALGVKNPGTQTRNILEKAIKIYRGHGGEVESRNVQARFLNPKYYNIHPLATEDIPRDEQILRFFKKGAY